MGGALLRCGVAAMLLAPRLGYAAEPCPFAGQVRMLQVQLFFGLDDQDGHPIGAAAWTKFLETAATPRFPEGFTVYDGHGQWLDTDTKKLAREESKILQILAPDSAEIRKKVDDLSHIFRETFHAKAVGLVTNESCAAFY